MPEIRMAALGRLVVAARWWVIGAWIVLAVAGVFAAPRATSALSYDFSLPGQPGSVANQQILARYGSGGDNAPVLVVVSHEPGRPLSSAARIVTAAVTRVVPGARVDSFATDSALRSADGRTGVILIYPRAAAGPDAYPQALPALERAARQASRQVRLPVAVTGQDALASGSGGGGPSVLAETLFGAVGALVVLALVFGSFLALMPLAIAAGSILTTFLILWPVAHLTSVSFIVQYLLALIGLGVAIDYALLIVTRWREERDRGLSNAEAVSRSLETAGRSVLFAGVTVAVSLAALIVLPVPFLRSVGYTGLLIPLISVVAALTLLPALLTVAGPRLEWPHRRSADPASRLWQRAGQLVIAHRWVAAIISAAILLALAVPVLGLRLGQPVNSSLAPGDSPAAIGLTRLDSSGLGAGLAQPVEVITRDPGRVRQMTIGLPGVAGVISPPSWAREGMSIVDVWTETDISSASGQAAAARVRTAARATGADVGGIAAQNADFVAAVYGNAWWTALIIVAVTFLLLAKALRSIVLPLKALILNVLSLAAAYGVTVLIWQHGLGTQLLFSEPAAGAITTWVPIAVFAFLFGLSMDYEVFLLSRIREEHAAGHPTDQATIRGLARTGRLVTSAALILFLAFISLSRVPDTDVKILATGLALGIILDATVVRGILAPALVAALGRANWWWLTSPRTDLH
jgi:RND superfamily putative drug exporter